MQTFLASLWMPLILIFAIIVIVIDLYVVGHSGAHAQDAFVNRTGIVGCGVFGAVGEGDGMQHIECTGDIFEIVRLVYEFL